MAAGLSALLFFWYFSPAMTALRAMPDPTAIEAVLHQR